MKTNIKSIILIVITLSLFFACKKKEDPRPTPASTTTTPATPTRAMTATVNSKSWAMGSTCYSINKAFGTYGFIGQTSCVSMPYTYISLAFTYTTGLCNLTKFGSFQASDNSC